MPKREDINTVLVIGSGPIIIGQACEFDYSGTQACKALRGLGYKIVLVNSNPYKSCGTYIHELLKTKLQSECKEQEYNTYFCPYIDILLSLIHISFP